MIQKLIKKYTEILNTLEQNNSIKDSTDYYPYIIDIKNTKEYLNDLKDLAINYTHSSLKLENLKVNRFEVIDKIGRAYVNYCDRPLNIETSLQDDERTLKIFLDD